MKMRPVKIHNEDKFEDVSIFLYENEWQYGEDYYWLGAQSPDGSLENLNWYDGEQLSEEFISRAPNLDNIENKCIGAVIKTGGHGWKDRPCAHQCPMICENVTPGEKTTAPVNVQPQPQPNTVGRPRGYCQK